MRSRLLLVVLLVLTTACTKKDDSAAKPDSSSGNVAAKTDSSAAEIATAKKKAEEESLAKADAEAKAEAAAKRLEAAKVEFKSLNEQMNAEKKSFSAAIRRARTSAARNKLNKNSPAAKLGPQFIEFAKKYEGTDEAFTALTVITSLGSSPSKTEAMEMLSTIIAAEPGSDRAARALSIFATRSTGETKNEAVEKMIKEYVDNDQMIVVISPMSRMTPSAQNEKWIGQVLENTTNPKVKGNALVAKLGMINRIKTYKERFAEADERTLKRVGEETLEYVNAERDAEELNELTGLMEAFASDHAGVVKKLETELFALKYLGIDCVAPEISGLDLDGSQFNLTDYRGKVVLLDFWGDW